MSLTVEERKILVEKWIEVAAGRFVYCIIASLLTPAEEESGHHPISIHNSYLHSALSIIRTGDSI